MPEGPVPVLSEPEQEEEARPASVSLGALYEEHVAGLLAFARGLLADGTLAEDAVQQAFVGLAARTPEGVADIKSYLYGAVRHAALNLMRGERRRENTFQAATRAGRFQIFADPSEDDDKGKVLSDAIAELRPEERQVVLLKVWGGLTFEEIGRAMETSPFTAASRLRAAFGRLKERLSRKGWP